MNKLLKMEFEYSVTSAVSELSEERVRFMEAKSLRKKTEEDAMLLSNRIALLKQEEAKALKKIEETRVKAKEIMDSRIRNLEVQKAK